MFQKENNAIQLYHKLESDPRRIARTQCPKCGGYLFIQMEAMPEVLQERCYNCDELITLHKTELSCHDWITQEVEKILQPEKEKHKAINNAIFVIIIAMLSFCIAFYISYY
jgi:hypothetical protein